MSDTSKKKVLFIIASEGYQPIEYLEPKRLLEDAGIKVITASDKPGGAVATDKSTTPVDLALKDVNPLDYNGIFFIGGSGAMECLDTPLSYKILNEAKKAQIPYGAICVASRILAKANVLAGKKATGWDGDNALRTIFAGNKVTYDQKGIVTDGLVVTAEGPKFAKEFAQGIMRVLTKKELGEKSVD